MLTQPVQPRPPWEPRKPDEYIFDEVRVEVEGAMYDAEIDRAYDDNATFESLVMSPESLQAVIRTMNLVSVEKSISVEELGIRCADDTVYVTYKVKIPNSSYVNQMARYAQEMNSYHEQMKNYETAMIRYRKDYEEYEKHVLEGQIIAARRRLDELEAKKRKTC